MPVTCDKDPATDLSLIQRLEDPSLAPQELLALLDLYSLTEERRIESKHLLLTHQVLNQAITCSYQTAKYSSAAKRRFTTQDKPAPSEYGHPTSHMHPNSTDDDGSNLMEGVATMPTDSHESVSDITSFMSSLRTPSFMPSQYASSIPPNQNWGSYSNQGHQFQTHGGHGDQAASAVGSFASYGQHDATNFNVRYRSASQLTSTSGPSIDPVILASTQTPSNTLSPGNGSAFASSLRMLPPTSTLSSAAAPVGQGATQRSGISNDAANRQWDEDGWEEIVSHFVMGSSDLFQHALNTTRSPRSTSTGLNREWGPFCLRVNRSISGAVKQWWMLIDTYFDFYARYGVGAGNEQLTSTTALSAYIWDQLLADFAARQVDMIGRFRRTYVTSWFGGESPQAPGWFSQIHDRMRASPPSPSRIPNLKHSLLCPLPRSNALSEASASQSVSGPAPNFTFILPHPWSNPASGVVQSTSGPTPTPASMPTPAPTPAVSHNVAPPHSAAPLASGTNTAVHEGPLPAAPSSVPSASAEGSGAGTRSSWFNVPGPSNLGMRQVAAPAVAMTPAMEGMRQMGEMTNNHSSISRGKHKAIDIYYSKQTISAANDTTMLRLKVMGELIRLKREDCQSRQDLALRLVDPASSNDSTSELRGTAAGSLVGILNTDSLDFDSLMQVTERLLQPLSPSRSASPLPGRETPDDELGLIGDRPATPADGPLDDGLHQPEDQVLNDFPGWLTSEHEE